MVYINTLPFFSIIKTAYSRCSKCPLFAQALACIRFLHLLTTASTTLLQTALNVKNAASLLEFVDIVNLHLIHTLLHNSPNQVISGVQVRTVGGYSSEKNEIRCFTLQEFDCVTRPMRRCAVLLKDEIVTHNISDSR